MIEFSEERRFIGFWFVYPGPATLRDGRRHDWFCGSWLNPDGTLESHYRFHYYDVPDDPSDGRRNWQGIKSKESVDAEGVKDHSATCAVGRRPLPYCWITLGSTRPATCTSRTNRNDAARRFLHQRRHRFSRTHF